MNTASDYRSAAWICLVSIAWCACFHHSRDWNSASRLLLTHAIAEHRTIEVTAFVAANGGLALHPPTRDLASPDKLRYFSDKAPGQSFLGAAPLFALRAAGWASEHPRPTDPSYRLERLSLRTADYLLAVFTSGLATAAAAVVVFLLLRRWSVGARAAAATAMALVLATPLQVYGTMYYGHVLAGLFAVWSVCCLDRSTEAQRSSIPSAFLTGLFAGLAVVVEYTMATLVFSLIMTGCLIGVSRFVANGGRIGGRSTLGVLAFLIGGLGPALFLAWYHWSVTGDPLTPPYRYEVDRNFAAVHAQSGGIPLSSLQPGSIWGLLFGASIGLLWFAPTAVWAIPGVVSLTRVRPLVALSIALFALSILLAIACFPNWNGGLATGPRFLTPMLPALFLAVGWSWHVASRNRLGRFLLTLTVPFVAAGFFLNAAMNAAGARKPFDASIVQFLSEAKSSGRYDRHLGDWLLSAAGMRPGFDGSLMVLVVVGLLGVVFVLRRTRQLV